MKPIDFIGATDVMHAPANWPTDRPPCGYLWIMREGGVMYSVWRPSWKQRIGVLLGRCIVLGVIANKHPPVSIGISRITEIDHPRG